MLLCEVGLRYEARDVQNAVVWDLEYWVTPVSPKDSLRRSVRIRIRIFL